MRMCSECGEGVSAARVKAMPRSVLCVKCAENKEQSESKPERPVAYYERQSPWMFRDLSALITDAERHREDEVK